MTSYNGVAATLLATGAALVVAGAAPPPTAVPRADHAAERVVASPVAGEDLFLTSDRCLACHKGVSTSTGVDVSIGYDWRASMMANSARDPYWQAAVRRELIEHPQAAAVIENTCSRCHMPMANVLARQGGGLGSVFANLPVGGSTAPAASLAADGVSCSVCHQISPEGLGEESSFEGGFVISTDAPPEGRPVYGPFEPDVGGAGIMHSATTFRPTEGPHVQSSDLCASCHTLFTHAVRADGTQGPEFPEQVPYLEWQASSSAAEGTSCQDCHMPLVGEDVPVTAVLGRARPEVSRHVFRGGNFFMLRVLNRYRQELGVTALPQELSLAADRTEEHLRTSTASVTVVEAALDGGRLVAEVDVRNLAGHKFPTAYPSRRAWLHVTVEDAAGRTVFESGAFSSNGSVVGNDNDEDAARFEPHYREITRNDQVQIYEAVIADQNGNVTTGLMSAERWLKENRLLPEGYGADRADPRIAVRGEATSDEDFGAGGDRVRYAVSVGGADGPFTVRAELWFQPIGFRWAANLEGYDSFETDRFVRYYRETASGSATVVASGSAVVR
ncbi:MAG: hypothetical protein OEO79_09675 [Gemmatimonadota bacterium]|nr:hypothetical protein [Gemmatimonadota bacterium]